MLMVYTRLVFQMSYPTATHLLFYLLQKLNFYPLLASLISTTGPNFINTVNLSMLTQTIAGDPKVLLLWLIQIVPSKSLIYSHLIRTPYHSNLAHCVSPVSTVGARFSAAQFNTPHDLVPQFFEYKKNAS